MGQEFVTLFTEMGTLPAVFLSIGILLGIIEIIIPGFGIFGVMGIVMTVLGIIFRILVGATLTQVFIMVFVIAAVAMLLFSIFTYSAKYGMISRTGLVENRVSVPSDFASDENNFAHMLGKEGITDTDLKPVGKVIIENLSYQVFSNGKYIPKGVRVKIIEVDGASIVVKKL